MLTVDRVTIAMKVNVTKRRILAQALSGKSGTLLNVSFINSEVRVYENRLCIEASIKHFDAQVIFLNKKK